MPAASNPSNRLCSDRKLLLVRSPGPIDSSIEDALATEFEIESRMVDTANVSEGFATAAYEIVLFDLRRGSAEALSMLRAVRRSMPDASLVILAADLPDDVVLEALRLDVSGLVIDPPSADVVAHCVRQVRDGHLCLDQHILRRAVKVLAERQIAAREAAKLVTPREFEIVRLVGRGLTNKEIAAALFVAEGTIKVHVHNIFDKLGVRSRKELAALAKEKGLV